MSVRWRKQAVVMIVSTMLDHSNVPARRDTSCKKMEKHAKVRLTHTQAHTYTCAHAHTCTVDTNIFNRFTRHVSVSLSNILLTSKCKSGK